MLIYFSKIQCMLNYDQKKDLNKSETLSIKCVQRLEENNSCVIFPNLYIWRGNIYVQLSSLYPFYVTPVILKDARIILYTMVT